MVVYRLRRSEQVLLGPALYASGGERASALLREAPWRAASSIARAAQMLLSSLGVF